MSDTMFDRIADYNKTKDSQSKESSGIEQTSEVKETSSLEKQESSQKEESPKEDKSYDVNRLNEIFGTQFQDEGHLKTYFDKHEKYKDFETQLETKDNELKTEREKYDSLIDAIDPEKLYPKKDIVALSQLAEKYPNADLGVLSMIRDLDLEKVNKIEALVLMDKLSVPSNVPDSVRKKSILDSLGIEEESDLTANDLYRIDREFVSKSNVLNDIKGYQPELPNFDFEQEKNKRNEKLTFERQELKNYNEKALKILLDGYKETKSVYKEDGKDRFYHYTVEQNFKDKFFDEVLDGITNTGIRIGNDNIQEAMAYVDNLFWLKNRDKIIHDAVKQALSEEKDKTHQEIHSDSPSNKTEASHVAPKIPMSLMEAARAGKLKPK